LIKELNTGGLHPTGVDDNEIMVGKLLFEKKSLLYCYYDKTNSRAIAATGCK